jgi:hypothetical protein
MNRMLLTLNDRELATILAALRLWQATDSADTEEQNDIATNGGNLDAMSNEEIDILCETVNRTTVAADTYYSAPVTLPTTKREGLCNAVQLIINAMEAEQHQSALLATVDLLNDIASKSNPYNIPGRSVTRRAPPQK